MQAARFRGMSDDHVGFPIPHLPEILALAGLGGACSAAPLGPAVVAVLLGGKAGGVVSEGAPADAAPMSLGEALPLEMARVRDHVMPSYIEIGPPGRFALAMMRADLDFAAKAMVEGDLPAMIAVYDRLKGFHT